MPRARSFLSGATIFGSLALTSVVGCDDHDLGSSCPQLLADAPTDAGSRTTTAEVVGQDTVFPCESLICIATDGRSGYCSRKCRTDAGCPDGFECRQIQSLGEFAGQSYCAWKRCQTDRDCGSDKDLCCSEVAGSDPVDPLALCGFASNGECG